MAVSQPWHPLRPRCARPPLPKGEARAETQPLAPRSAAPLRGSPQCAHWGKGSPESDKSRREKTGRSADISFPSWQFLCHGDPSVSLTLDSSPKRGAKGVGQDSLAPQGAAPLRGSPQCAHWGKGSPESDKSRREKTGRSADISFPSWQFLCHGDPSVSLTLDSSPKRGAKGVGQDSLAPQGAAPLRGSPQCAHWGKGSPESDKSRREKTGRSADISFPKWQSLSHGDPLSLAIARQLPRRGSQGRGR